MITDLRELCSVVNEVATRAIEHVAANTQSGQMYLSYGYFVDLISEEDFMKYADLIAAEISDRPEVLEPVEFKDGELDINIGLDYCQAYQWCDGDEEIFGCSFDEWVEKEAKPTYSPMSLTRLAEVGENAVKFLLDYDKPSQYLYAQALDLQPAEAREFARMEKDLAEYFPYADLYIGKWRVHVADTGELHGTFMDQFNDKKPIVEFYDMTTIDPKFCPNGQFTGGQYYVDTILGKDDYGSGKYPLGLSLQGDCPAWTVSAKEMKTVIAYLRSFEEYKAAHKPSLSTKIESAQHKADSQNSAHKAPDAPQR